MQIIFSICFNVHWCIRIQLRNLLFLTVNLGAFSARLTHIVVHNPPHYKAKTHSLFIKQLIMSKLGENFGHASVCFCEGMTNSVTGEAAALSQLLSTERGNTELDS